MSQDIAVSLPPPKGADPSTGTCPKGQVPRNGQCVSVQEAINIDNGNQAAIANNFGPYGISSSDVAPGGNLTDEEKYAENVRSDIKASRLMQKNWNQFATQYIPLVDQISSRFSPEQAEAQIGEARETGLSAGLAAKQMGERGRSRYGMSMTKNQQSMVDQRADGSITAGGIGAANFEGQNNRDATFAGTQELISSLQGVGSQGLGTLGREAAAGRSANAQFNSNMDSANAANSAMNMQVVSTGVGIGLAFMGV